MSTETIFALRGNTVRLSASPGLPGQAVQMSVIAGTVQASDYTITNLGPAVAFVGWGPDKATALANAREPTTGDPRFCVVVYPGQLAIEAKHGAWFAASTAAGSADILISPGHGLVHGFAGPSSQATSQVEALQQQQLDALELILTELQVLTLLTKEGFILPGELDDLRSDMKSDPQPQ